MKKITLLLCLLIFSSMISQNFSVESATLWVNGFQNKDTIPIGGYTASSFNFNPTIQLPSDQRTYKNLLNEYFSLFLVFKSDTEEENTVFLLRSRKNETKVTNKQVHLFSEIPFEKSDTRQGAILSYIAKMEGFSKRNSLSFEDFSTLVDINDKEHQLLEIMLFPKLLTKTEREKVESYLSIKYGISLIGEKNYINLSRDTIWSYNKNKQFNNRVTGFGRDDASTLYQKQSGNAEKDGLYIGLQTIEDTNLKNSGEIHNGTFMLWGDNSGLTVLEADEDDFQSVKKMDRVWKTQKTSERENDTLETQVAIHTLEMLLSDGTLESTDDHKLWLAISSEFNNEFNYFDATYFKQTKDNDSIVTFDKVFWTGDSQYFTVVSAPDFFVLYEPEKSCAEGVLSYKMSLNIIGGNAPYTVLAKAENETFEFSTDTEEYQILLKPGVYELTVTDAAKNIHSEWVFLEKEGDFSIELSDTWLLNESGIVNIIPVLHTNDENKEAFEFEWKYNNERIAVGEQFTANNPGKYELSVKNPLGCEINIPFKVEEDYDLIPNITLHPNPVNALEEFTVTFNMEAQTDIQIKIFTMNGQLLKQDDLKGVLSHTYQNFLTTSGSYLIAIETEKGTRTFKIVVK